MRTILTLAFLLMAGTAWAGPEFLALVNVSPRLITSNAIGGVTSISSNGTTDTGTGEGTGTGTISVVAQCAVSDTGDASVRLVVNGTTAEQLTCNTGGENTTYTLTASVNGSYTARVYGTVNGDGYFSASSFSFPTQ